MAMFTNLEMDSQAPLCLSAVPAVQEHHDGRGDSAVDVDPEVIRKGVRSLMQQVAQIERERVCSVLCTFTQRFHLRPKTLL